jgi:hypothetical protein
VPVITRLTLIVLHAALGVGAVGAGQAFLRDPSGESLGVPVAWLEGSPFPDYRVPGLFLAIVIGGTNLLGALALARRHPLAARLSLATGVLLVAWIAVQTAIIGLRHWSQAIWWATFVVVAALAARLVQRER